MICEWGMNDKLGVVTYDESDGGNRYLGFQGYREKSYSDETAKQIDKEVKNLLEEAHRYAIRIITENKAKVELMAKMLIEFETLDKQDIKEIMEDTWDVEKKKKRLQVANELQKTPPPPPPIENKLSKQKNEGQAPQEI